MNSLELRMSIEIINENKLMWSAWWKTGFMVHFLSMNGLSKPQL